MKHIILAAALLNCSVVHALTAADTNLFVSALKTGASSAPVPTGGQLGPAIKSLQNMTGDSGPLTIEVRRIARFQQQVRCGRVAFIIVQPSTQRGWPELGGQLNMCEDGLPPWRVCKVQPNVLVAPDHECPDKSATIDTPEVAQAMQAAFASGSLNEDQMRQRLIKDASKQKAKPAPNASNP